MGLFKCNAEVGLLHKCVEGHALRVSIQAMRDFNNLRWQSGTDRDCRTDVCTDLTNTIQLALLYSR